MNKTQITNGVIGRRSCPDLPPVSVIRPLTDRFAGAVATIASFTADGLFQGQSPEFFTFVNKLAKEADDARRT